MSEEQENQQKKRPKRRKRFNRLLVWSSILLGILLLLQTVFFFYSDQIFGRVLKEVINQGSSGLYSLQYSKIRFNLFANQFDFSDANLEVNRAKLEELEANGDVRNVYEGHCRQIEISGPSLWKLYSDKELTISVCRLIGPEINVELNRPQGKDERPERLEQVVTEYLELLDVEAFSIDDASFSILSRNGKRSDFKNIGGSITGLKLKKVEDEPDLIVLDVSCWSGANEFVGDSAAVSVDSFFASTADSILKFNQFKYGPTIDKGGNHIKSIFTGLSFEGFDFGEFFENGRIKAKTGSISSGTLAMRRQEMISPERQYENISQYFKEIELNNLIYNNLEVRFDSEGSAPKLYFASEKAHGTIHGFGFDTSNFVLRSKQMFADQLTSTFKGCAIFGDDDKPEFRLERLRVSTEDRLIQGQGIELISVKQPENITKLAGLDVSGIQIWDVLYKKSFDAHQVILESPYLARKLKAPNSQTNSTSLRESVKRDFGVFRCSQLKIANGLFMLNDNSNNAVLKAENINLGLSQFNVEHGKKGFEEFTWSKNGSGNLENLEYQIDSSTSVRLSKVELSSYGKTVAAEAFTYTQQYKDTLLETKKELALRNLYGSGFELKELLRSHHLKMAFFQAKGPNKVNWYLGSDAQKSSGLKSVLIEEFILDSLKSEMIHPKATGKSFIDDSRLQVCDLYWNPADSLVKSISTYGFEWEGRTFGTISQPAGHAFFSEDWSLSSHDENLVMNKLRVEPLGGSLTLVKAQLFVDNIAFNGFSPKELVEQQRIVADQIVVSKANALISDKRKLPDNVRIENLTHPGRALGEGLSSISAGTLEFSDTKLQYISERDSFKNELSVLDLDAYLYNFNLNGSTVMTEKNLFCSNGSVVNVKELRQSSKDGNMNYRIGKGYFHPHQRIAHLSDIDISNSYLEDHVNHFSVRAKQSDIKGLNFYDFWVSRMVSADSIYLKQPFIRTYSRERDNKQEYYEQELPRQLTEGYSSWDVNKVYFDEGELSLGYVDSLDIKHYEVVNGLRGQLGSIDIRRGVVPEFLYCQEAVVEVENYKRDLADSMNLVYASKAKFDLKRNMVEVDSFCILPKYEAIKYATKKGHQADWIQLTGVDAVGWNFNFKEYLYKGRVEIDSLELANGDLKVYTDKALPPPPAIVKPMPQDMLRKLPFGLAVQRIYLTNWNILYEEQHPDVSAPGRIFFTDFEAQINNVCNQKRYDNYGEADVKISTKLMGKSNMLVEMQIPYYRENDLFYFSGALDEMDIKEINPILENLAHLSVKKGKSEGLYFNGYADEAEAVGEMSFYYSKLKVNLLNSTLQKRGFKQVMGSALVNTFIVSSSNRSKLPRTGEIYYARDHSKSVFHYGAQAIISGIIDSIR